MSLEDQRPYEPDGCARNAAPYVLGALTDEESEAFREHLRSCAICREEVAALRVVAAALPAAAPQLQAPGALRRRVMSAVHEDARVRQALSGERPGGRPSPGGRRLRPALAALAFAAAVIVLAVIAFAPGGGGGARVVRAQVLAPGASALVRVSGGHAELAIAGMPQTAPGRVYEVWVQAAGPPRPTDALFTVSRRGDASVGVPGGLAGVRRIMVTSEPLGGSSAPTRPPVIVARLG